MRQHLNTLYVTLEGAYLHKDGQAVDIRYNGESKLRVPLHNLDGIVTFGWDTMVTAGLMQGCAEAGVSLSFISPYGKFMAASQGGVSGNILLRKDQYRSSESPEASLAIAQNIVAAKIANSRTVIQRAARDYGEREPEKGAALIRISDSLKHRIRMTMNTTNLDMLRGVEGEAAANYFSGFPSLFTQPDTGFSFTGRSKRPPTDPFNAVLSLLYVILMHDCRSACESCGLDPQCGFLHRDRPGRYSLALDLAEEFRAFLADRLAFSLVNRKQITTSDFEYKENGAVLLKDEPRKKVLAAWQERKQDEITHPFLEEKTTVGLLPFLQARLLTRYLRGDIDAYPAFVWK